MNTRRGDYIQQQKTTKKISEQEQELINISLDV